MKKQKKMHRRIRYDKIREEKSDDVIDTEKREKEHPIRTYNIIICSCRL